MNEDLCICVGKQLGCISLTVGVELTDKGRRLAVQVVRRHRLSECLLANILRIEWGKVHELAYKLEHGLRRYAISYFLMLYWQRVTEEAKIFKLKIVVDFVCRVCVRSMKESAEKWK